MHSEAPIAVYFAERNNFKMKKVFSLMMVMLLAVSVTACGGSSGRADEALTGKYIGVTGTALGITLSGEEKLYWNWMEILRTVNGSMMTPQLHLL